jgi:hypothetical protein
VKPKAAAGRAVVAEHAAACDARIVEHVDIPVQRRRCPHTAADIGADIETGAPGHDDVSREHVPRDLKGLSEQIERAAMRSVRFSPGIAVDQVR